MKKHICNTHVVSGVLALSITLLPSCALLDWIQGKGEMPTPTKTTDQSSAGNDIYVTDGTEVLVTMNGKPIATKASVEKEFQQLLQEQPQLAQMIPLMGGKDALMDRLQNAIIERALVRRYAQENNFAQQVAYQQEYDRMVNQVKDMLNVKFFNNQYAVDVPESEVRAFYNKNKETMPELMESPGGVKAKGIKFDAKDEAVTFLNLAKQLGWDKAVADVGVKEKVEDFDVVNNQSFGMDTTLREKITGMTKFPSQEMIEAGDAFWVINASSKQAPQYHDYAKVKDQLKKYLEGQKREEKLGVVMKELEVKYNIERKKPVEKQSAPVPHAKPEDKKQNNDAVPPAPQTSKQA